jgi:hypothetical protein
LDGVRGTETYRGNPHLGWPWELIEGRTVREIAHVSAKRTFTMVRNPYARALSCYLSKIGGYKHVEPVAWARFCKRFGIDVRSRPSFDEYLEMIEREPLEMMDMHWAPQVANLLQPVARIDEIFYIEQSYELDDFLMHWSNVRVERVKTGSRNALAKLAKYYTDSSIERVRRIYADDFDLLGYSKELLEQESRERIRHLPGKAGGMAPLLKHMASKDWVEKLKFLDQFEALNGVDFSTDMARFCCGGPHESRMRSVRRVLADCSANWMLLREIEASFRSHGDKANASRFATAARAAHKAILGSEKRAAAKPAKVAEPKSEGAATKPANTKPKVTTAKAASPKSVKASSHRVADIQQAAE